MTIHKTATAARLPDSLEDLAAVAVFTFIRKVDGQFVGMIDD